MNAQEEIRSVIVRKYDRIENPNQQLEMALDTKR